jgi:hypothetical protein
VTRRSAAARLFPTGCLQNRSVVSLDADRTRCTSRPRGCQGIGRRKWAYAATASHARLPRATFRPHALRYGSGEKSSKPAEAPDTTPRLFTSYSTVSKLLELARRIPSPETGQDGASAAGSNGALSGLARLGFQGAAYAFGVMRDDGEVGARGLISRVCVRKVKSESRVDHQITFARSFHEALPIKHRDCRRPRAIKPARSISRAALVTVGLWTPSISASRS